MFNKYGDFNFIILKIQRYMGMFKKALYGVYKKFQNNKAAATTAHFIYNELIPYITGKYKPAAYNYKSIVFKKRKAFGKKKLKEIKMAIICDDMTYKNYKNVCNVDFLTPDNWIDKMNEFQPDLFFCESAWSGINKYKDCWRGKIYKNENVLYETRHVLFNILDFCKRSGIKTVFWNKEDPIYFDDMCHCFSDTALKFDYIFTTAEECVGRYKAMGHKNVFVSGFGFAPELFNCEANAEKENSAVFAGSWYADHPQRCADMEKIFDMVISMGIRLDIYDRYYDSSNPINSYPEKYKRYIHKGVPYEKLSRILSKSKFAININTEKDSKTMFARRVYELMACRCIVISNESKAMKEMFGNNVWFVNEKFDLTQEKEIVADNYDFVINNCTNNAVLLYIFKIIGLLQ